MLDKKFVLTRSAVTSVIGFIILLCTIHASTIFHNNHREVVLNYGLSALYVFQGEYYRLLTALLLHSNLQHLIGNVASLLFFAIPLCSIIGSSKALALIILSGCVGNLLNVYLYRSVRLSIGASTAVMGAVGILVAIQIIRHYLENQVIKIKRIESKVFLECEEHPLLECEEHPLLECEEHLLLECEEHPLLEYEEHSLLECEEHSLLECEEHLLLECEEHSLLECEEHPLLECEEQSFLEFNGDELEFNNSNLSKFRTSAIFIFASGVAFVGMMSGGENTDIPAHLFGFLAGIIIGFFLA